MGAPRAFRVERDRQLVGFLGEGPGRFLTATRSGLPAPHLATAHYTSRSVYEEAAISTALVEAADFDAALAALAGAGFDLVAAEHAELFGPRGPR